MHFDFSTLSRDDCYKLLLGTSLFSDAAGTAAYESDLMQQKQAILATVTGVHRRWRVQTS
jgi:hypothetical protein